jgi:hypothetical protein
MSTMTTIKPTSATDFFDSFQHQPTKIQGQPAYDDLRQLRDSLFANAAAIPSTRGGGAHGHLGMLMTPTVYATLSATPWVQPPVPVLPALNNLTGPQIAEANRRYADDYKEYLETNNLDKALLRQITTTIEPVYLKPIYEPYVGLLNRTCHYTITWLIDNYGKLLPQDLTNNRLKLNEPYSAADPFQLLVERFQEAYQIAADGNLPISDADLINSGIVALEKTGTLDKLIDKWNDLPQADRSTWIQFKNFFTPKILEYQRSHQNLRTQHSANAAFDPYYQQLSDWHEQQATTQHAMATIAATNATLLDSLTKMQKALDDLTLKVNNTTEASTTTTNSRLRNRPRLPPRPKQDQGSYCWTHGYLVHKDHNSQTCKNKAPGHQNDATRTNTKDGNQEGKPT